MNGDTIDSTPKVIESALRATLAAVHPGRFLPRQIEISSSRLRVAGRDVSLDGIRGVTLLGLGKAAVAQVEVVGALLRARLGERLAIPPAFVVTKAGHGTGSDRVVVLESGHPTPDARSRNAASELLLNARNAPEDHLLVLCLSGGGSSLAVAPRAPFTLAEKLFAHGALLNSGASIEETNLIRRELSSFKNGGLLAAAGSDRVLTLITSDVPTDDLAVVASGPTLHEALDVDRVRAVARERLPRVLARRIDAQLRGTQRRTWYTRTAAAVARHEHVVACVGDHASLITAAREALGEHGYGQVTALDRPLSTTIEEGIQRHLRELETLSSVHRSFALVTGGELPIIVRGDGRGGRNTEFVLRMARALWVERCGAIPDGVRDRLVIAAIGTDGTDGPTDAAGGWLLASDLDRATSLGLSLDESLADNDSLTFLDALGCSIRTGPTDTNLMDLRVIATAPHTRPG